MPPGPRSFRSSTLLRRSAPWHLALGAAIALSLGFAPPAAALVTTLLSSEANVSGSLAQSTQTWSDSDQSIDLAPSISVSQSFSTNTSSNSFAFSAHAVSVGRFQMSTRSTAGSGGTTSDAAAAHDFTIRFSIDDRASYELRNGNSTGTFPEATSNGDEATASLVYELRLEGAPSPVFVYSAPTDGAAGTYRSGVIPAGTYVWTGTASAVANGDACCGAQSAAAIGNVRLQLDDAPTSVPALWPAAGGGLALLLGALGRSRLGRSQRPSA